MRNISLLTLAAALACIAPAAAADQQGAVRTDAAFTRQAVSAHLDRNGAALDTITSNDATDARIIVAARRAHAVAVKYWTDDDYVPAEDYARATDALLAVANAQGRGASDAAFASVGRMVDGLSPASAMWLTSFAGDLYSRALQARSADPSAAARDLARAAGVARASAFATLAASGAPAGSADLPLDL